MNHWERRVQRLQEMQANQPVPLNELVSMWVDDPIRPTGFVQGANPTYDIEVEL